MECVECGTEVTGEYEPCPVCRLDGNIRELYDLFIEARGNLKQVQRRIGLSYPTVRNRIEEMFQELSQDDVSRDPQTILSELRAGELDVDEAERFLRNRSDS
jgi:hypothetical protein